MRNIETKKMIFGGLSLVCLPAVLTFSIYAWFYFPMTQYTLVYTDSVTDAEVKAEVYLRSANEFIEVNAENNTLNLQFLSDRTNDVVNPYFFLWAGEYTTNDNYRTLYRITVSYSNADMAFPKYLDLYGVFDFDFICHGNNKDINARFMKLSYFVPKTQSEINSYLTATYTEFSEETYTTPGYEMKIGRLESSGASTMAYSFVFYLLLETDVDALNENADLLAEENGVLDADYNIAINLFFRTAPANTVDIDYENYSKP